MAFISVLRAQTMKIGLLELLIAFLQQHLRTENLHGEGNTQASHDTTTVDSVVPEKKASSSGVPMRWSLFCRGTWISCH